MDARSDFFGLHRENLSGMMASPKTSLGTYYVVGRGTQWLLHPLKYRHRRVPDDNISHDTRVQSAPTTKAPHPAIVTHQPTVLYLQAHFNFPMTFLFGTRLPASIILLVSNTTQQQARTSTTMTQARTALEEMSKDGEFKRKDAAWRNWISTGRSRDISAKVFPI